MRQQHASECGGTLVIVGQDQDEPRHVLMDRAWLLARMLSANAQPARAAHRIARAWACWEHLGCEYDAETMAAVRRAHYLAHAPRTL